VMSEMKKRLQRKGARKGFTLVELLIVIIIIGILAGAMMLVAGTSRDSAEASRIISDLRNMKAAALMWISEDPTVDGTNWEALDTSQPNLDQLNKYIDRPLTKEEHNYVFKVQKFAERDSEGTITGEILGEAWVLGYKLTDARPGVKSNLQKQAASAGLFGGDEDGMRSASDWPPTSDAFYEATDDYVYVIVQ